MSEDSALIARIDEHLRETDRRHGELMTAVARIDTAIRGNGVPGLAARMRAVEERCCDCTAAADVATLAARIDERQSSLAEIAPVRAAGVSARAVVVAALIAAAGGLSAAGLAWHSTRTAQAQPAHPTAPP